MNNFVKEERTARGLTQTQLADMVGVSRQTIFSIETSKYVPSVILALKLAKVFGKSVEEVFQLTDADRSATASPELT